MKSTKKIQLEIYSNKEHEFYLALLKYKITGEPDTEVLKRIADTIHFDKNSIESAFELTPAQETRIHDKLLAVHEYLLKSKRDSPDYFKISKESFEKFQASGFCKELHEFMKLFELSRHWVGREESVEVKAFLAMASWFMDGLMKGIGNAVEKSLTKGLNAAVALRETQQQPIKIRSNEKGNLLYSFGNESEAAETEIFIEKEGQIRKVKAELQELPGLESVNSMFMRAGEKVIRMRGVADNIEITHYENVKVKNRKLDLSEAVVGETILVPKEHFEREISIARDGSYIFQPKPNNGENGSEIFSETNEEIISGAEEVTSNENGVDDMRDISTPSSIYNFLDENISRFLRLPKNTPEHIEARDKIIIGLYELLKEHYPDLTKHTYTTAVGYIGSRMGLIDTEQQHDNADRKQSFRKYLRDTAYNILKKSIRD